MKNIRPVVLILLLPAAISLIPPTASAEDCKSIIGKIKSIQAKKIQLLERYASESGVQADAEEANVIDNPVGWLFSSMTKAKSENMKGYMADEYNSLFRIEQSYKDMIPFYCTQPN